MRIAAQVASLPEVGSSLVSQAKRIDARQDRIDEMQSELNVERMEFLAELGEQWSDNELLAAGIFRGERK